MAFIHGKDTFISLNAKDLSPFVNASELNRTGDKHDVTTYGKQAHVYNGGLKDGTATMAGVYDNSLVNGPRGVIRPLIGTVVELIRRPEGTGTGKPQDRVNVLVEGYRESNPVADMVAWTCDMQLSDVVDSTPQA